MVTFSGDMLRGHLDTLVLATVAQGEAHGFQIMGRLNAFNRDAFNMKEGTLYPVLYRLDDHGFIESRWEDEHAPRKGPRKRLYRITPKGKRELAERRQTWNEFVTVIGKIIEA